MRTLKKIVCALVLTVLLMAIMALDGTMLLTGSPDSQLTTPELECAAVGQCVEITFEKAHYDSDGNFVGCWGKGYDCAIVVVTVAGKKHQLEVAAGGMLLR